VVHKGDRGAPVVWPHPDVAAPRGGWYGSSMRAGTNQNQLSLVEVDATGMADCPDAIVQIFDGTIAGVIVRGVIEPAQAGDLVQRIERNGDSLPCFRPPVFKGRVYGRPLVSASSGMRDYLDDAERFRVRCAEIYPQFPAIEQRIDEALNALGGGRPVTVPQADGSSYLAATVRELVEGDRLPLHYENETLRSPVMAALRPLLDPSTLMSFYLPLAIPPSGGILRLFHTNCSKGGDSLIDRLGGEERARPHFEERGFQLVFPGIGDLLVFDGGRWYHDVTPISGGSRWTLGGFLALTRDRRGVHYWS
jgi:hypothetical protein